MKICVFIDYWNFQLTLNERIGEKIGNPEVRIKIAWRDLGPILAKEACKVLACDPNTASYEGCYIYTSFNPSTAEGKKFKNWVITWLDRQPGVNVQLRERKPKALPRCPICHREISHCPHAGCGQPIVATVEKGIDTLVATDLIRLGTTNSYDAAVLASLDADMVPAVEFVQSSGKKVIQAGFPPKGIDLASECWGSFDVLSVSAEIQRP